MKSLVVRVSDILKKNHFGTTVPVAEAEPVAVAEPEVGADIDDSIKRKRFRVSLNSKNIKQNKTASLSNSTWTPLLSL